MQEPFYRQLGEHRFESLPPTAGPWSPHAQHAGPPSALLARAIMAHEHRPEMRLSDFRLDILGPIPLVPLDIEVRTVRGGRSMELLEATALAKGASVAVARAWRIVSTPEDYPVLPHSGQHEGSPVPGPEAGVGGNWLQMPGAHVDGYLSAVEWRILTGGPGTDGTTLAWGCQRGQLVEGEEPTPWQRTLVVADSGGGITLAVDPRRHAYINCDLHVALHREPVGEWVRMDSRALASPGHGGLVQTHFADTEGELGIGLQTMFAQAARS